MFIVEVLRKPFRIDRGRSYHYLQVVPLGADVSNIAKQKVNIQ